MVATHVFGSICKVINIDNHVTIGIVSKYLVGMESVKNIRGNWKGLRKGERGIPYPIPPIHFCRDSHSSFWASKSFLVPLSGSNEGRVGNHASRGNHSTLKDFLLKRG